MKKKYFVDEPVSVGTEVPGERVGCNVLTRLAKENGNKVFPHYSGFLVLAGRGRYIDWNGREHALRPGVMAQHLPGRPHTILREERPFLQMGIALPTSWFSIYCRMGLIDPHSPVIPLALTTSLLDRFWGLHCRLHGLHGEAFSAWLIDLQAFMLDLRRVAEVPDRGRREVWIHRACALLDDGCSPVEVAEALRMSYSHLRRRFRDVMGMSASQYAASRRMEEAKGLLLDTDLPITAIAARLGFADIYTFSKRFKSLVGVAPTAFRQATNPSDFS
ncbi:MAG: helix-turn-helix transcriptional regulator [Planctomycetota bacterium]